MIFYIILLINIFSMLFQRINKIRFYPIPVRCCFFQIQFRETASHKHVRFFLVLNSCSDPQKTRHEWQPFFAWPSSNAICPSVLLANDSGNFYAATERDKEIPGPHDLQRQGDRNCFSFCEILHTTAPNDHSYTLVGDWSLCVYASQTLCGYLW